MNWKSKERRVIVPIVEQSAGMCGLVWLAYLSTLSSPLLDKTILAFVLFC